MDILADFNLSLEDLKSPEPLQFDEEMAGVGDLMSKAVTLESIYQEITKSNSISRSQVEYLKDQCGVDFGPNYPPCSFTTDPSQVNLKVAQEGFVQEFFTSLKSFLKKVVTVIIGILKWIWDTLSGGKKLRENTAIVAENAKVVAAANAEIKSKLAEAGALPDVEGDPDYLAAEASMKLVHDHWSLWHDDYLRIGRFSQFLDKFAEMFIAFFPMVEARVDLFRELITIKETPGDVGNEIELTARFLRATKSIQVGHFVQLFQSMAGDFNTMGKPLEEMSYTDVANNLVGISHHMMQTMDPHVSAMNAPQYTVYMRDAINDTKRNFNEGLLHHNNAEARVTNSLIDEYKKLLTVTPQQTYSEQMRLRYKNMIDSMTLEIRGLQQTVAIYGTLEVAVATMLKEYAASVFALNAYLEKKMAGMDPKGAYYKHAKEVLDRSRKELKRLR